MRITRYCKSTLIAFSFLFLITCLTNGQTYSFRNYGAEKNIPSGFVYSLTQSDDGFLWVGTAAGIARFDGFDFFPVQYPDSSETRYPAKSLKDKNGTLWFGCNDGMVYYVKENKLITVNLSNEKSISELIQSPDGQILIIPQGGEIFSVNPLEPGKIQRYRVNAEPVFFSASATSEGNLLIGTQESLLVCKLVKDSLQIIRSIDGFDSYPVTSIHKRGDENQFIIGTDENGLFRLKLSDSGEELSRLENPEFESLKVQSINEDSEGSLWVTTIGSGVVRFQISDLNEVTSIKLYNINSGLAGNDVKSAYEDLQGNIWFGFYGEGISMLTSSALSYYSPGNNIAENNILYVKNIERNYFLGTPAGFHIFDPASGKSLSFTRLSSQTGQAEIKSYHLDASGNLWIGTGGNGLWLRDKNGNAKRIYRSGDTGSDDIKDIQMDEQYVWLATTNGVIVIDKKGNFVKKFDLNSRLPHNSINKILLTDEGAYIGTESENLYRIDKDFEIVAGDLGMSGSTRNKILAFSKGKDGSIWTATEGNGVFRFLNDTLMGVTQSEGLMSNYTYSILADSDNDIWIGHSKGFSRYDPSSGTVRVLGSEFPKIGICNTNGIFESADKKIFIGTTEGFLVYDREKDNKTRLAPFTNINYIEINDVSYPYQPSFVLPFARYKIRVHYSGINFSDPEKVYYSSILDNFDVDRTETTSREASYSLSDGKYRFNVMSVSQDGQESETVSFNILIKKPFYRMWWFILLVLATVIVIVFVIVREREKAQKKIQEYLEKELEARTRVVVKQKGELELQNIEITDSINYAKRIQTSILPDINKLKETFSDAFILFQPRDIVSGDFYWFDKVGDDKFILVCADSTGHGVPGAFMSMIGSTLLQDIINSKKISKPSEILKMLDRQIFSTLNQNAELGISNDGMDLVVCEFNVSKRHVRFASAMRPVILVIDGESLYIKGSRSSVGGESVNEKFFDDQEYYLNEGDTIYLFSDGMPDQFGGRDGKKLKIARLKKLIESISKMPMNEQKAEMTRFYLEWKGSFDQVDDVLLMGVRV